MPVSCGQPDTLNAVPNGVQLMGLRETAGISFRGLAAPAAVLDLLEVTSAGVFLAYK